MTASEAKYLTAYDVLDHLYKKNGLEELAILLGAMHVNGADGKPMDLRMLEYWEQASAKDSGVDAIVGFLRIYAAHLTPPAPAFVAFIQSLADQSSEARGVAAACWQASLSD